jgi:hypothetical protein
MSYPSDPVTDEAKWERSTFDADGLEGEKLQLLSTKFGNLGTVVVWPGRATRVYWPTGRTADYYGRGSRGCAIQDVEERAGIE